MLYIYLTLLFIIYILFARGNMLSLYIFIKNRLFYLHQYAKQELPSNLVHYINYNFNTFCEINDSFILVDFGCGDGSTLDKLNICKNKIGIEIDPNIFNLALQNTKNIIILNDDILNYSFCHNCILYMYEPLWICEDYLYVYTKLFESLYHSNYKIYIIYVSGIEKLLDDQFFCYFDFKILHKKNIGSVNIKLKYVNI